MNLKSRIKLLEQHAKNSASDASVCQPPPDKAMFLKPDGYYDMVAYRSALEAWSVELFGKSLYEVTEKIAQEEGF